MKMLNIDKFSVNNNNKLVVRYNLYRVIPLLFSCKNKIKKRINFYIQL